MASSTPTPFSKRSLWAALAGAGGGLLSFFVGELVAALAWSEEGASSLGELLLSSALWSGAIGLTIGAALLVHSNVESLRGQWHRDLLVGLPLFFILSFAGGIAGQLAYTLQQNPLTRGIGWALMGASSGIGIGLLRRDMIQAGRGACGGAIGGFIGGFIFDGLTLISSAGGGSFSRLIGQIIMGALIALLMKVVQESLKSAWLLGISTGPYEGKEYPLNTARVTVGREDSNAIALFREREMAAQLGALVFQNGSWMWQGTAVPINGAFLDNAVLNPGDTLQLGTTRFRFQSRSVKTASNYPGVSHESAHPAAYSSPATPPRTVANVGPTPIPSSSPAAPPPTFALMALSGQLLRLPDLSSPVTVGRIADNGLVLSDAGVSSRHARLEMASGTLCITDLGSTNGTFINGTKIPPQTLKTLRVGDRIRFGSLEYTLRAG
jgi:uncharacterized membrane protein